MHIKGFPYQRIATGDGGQWTALARGGHFASLEVPDRFVEDVRACFRRRR